MLFQELQRQLIHYLQGGLFLGGEIRQKYRKKYIISQDIISAIRAIKWYQILGQRYHI